MYKWLKIQYYIHGVLLLQGIEGPPGPKGSTGNPGQPGRKVSTISFLSCIDLHKIFLHDGLRMYVGFSWVAADI